MTDSSSSTSITDGSTSDSATSGDSDINAEIAQMNEAFEVATQTNIAITVNKTIDGAEETAAQQRPNIG